MIVLNHRNNLVLIMKIVPQKIIIIQDKVNLNNNKLKKNKKLKVYFFKIILMIIKKNKKIKKICLHLEKFLIVIY